VAPTETLRRRATVVAWRATQQPQRAWRHVTAPRRLLPHFLILGAQRSGTTSLYDWLGAHAQVVPAAGKEVHYFDRNYARGPRWYRAQFPWARPGRVTGEATPYLLFHPLAPARVAADLPDSTRFVVLLRHPVERALSHYWHERRLRAESEPLQRALDLESTRLAGQFERVLAGERSFAHFHYSYAARGRYAEQLERWFDHVGRDRLLIVESERLFADASAAVEVERWLGLDPAGMPFPALNEARRDEPTEAAVRLFLEQYFAEYNEELFTLLGRRLWGR